MLTVGGTATKVETLPRAYTFSAQIPREMPDAEYRLDRSAPVRPGFLIADVTVKNGQGQDVASLGSQTLLALDPAQLGLQNVRDLQLEVAPDRGSVRLTGTLVRNPAQQGQDCCMALPIVLTEQRRSSVELPQQQVMGTLTLPAKGQSTTVTLPMPPLARDLENVQYHLGLQLDGVAIVWPTAPKPGSAWVSVQNRRYVASITPTAEQVRVDLLEGPLP
jgi:hypothetical protein